MAWSFLAGHGSMPSRPFGPAVQLAYRFLLLQVVEAAPSIHVPMALRFSGEPERWVVDNAELMRLRFPKAAPMTAAWRRALLEGIAAAREYVMTEAGMAEQAAWAEARREAA